MDIDKFEKDDNCSRYLFGDGDSAPDHVPHLRALFGLDTAPEYYELRNNIQQFGDYVQLYLPIGVDYGGNHYAEVRAGKYKGWVGGLDHEYMGDGLEEFVVHLGLKSFSVSSESEQADLITDHPVGLVWLHATSFQEFIGFSLRYDDDDGPRAGTGYVVDSPAAAQARGNRGAALNDKWGDPDPLIKRLVEGIEIPDADDPPPKKKARIGFRY
jgi:hypothetical protein